MLKALIVFGSKSDKPVYEQMCKDLEEKNIEYELRICSAHRTPDFLKELLKDDHNIIIAGAGLAAHLPGVIASKTIRPVIGIPVNSNFNGLDSFLSILQMPPGIPVLCSGINSTKAVADFVEKALIEEYSEVNVIGIKGNKAVDKCIGVLEEFNVNFGLSDKEKEDAINICCFDLEKDLPESMELTIYVPLKDRSEAEDSIHLMKKSKKGIFVGLNRGENAAIAAIEIMAVNGKYKKKLNAYREQLKKQVLEDDAEEKK